MVHRITSATDIRRRLWPALLVPFAAAAIGFAGCADEDGFAPSLEETNHDVVSWAAEEDDEEDLAGTAPDPATEENNGPAEEVCDGHDNDRNGEIDEGTGGAPCGMASGDEGIQICVGGYLRCQACEPGATRQVDCGCQDQRADTCDEYGVWQLGVCDGCSEPEPGPCGFCGYIAADGTCVGSGECEPGDIMYRRCDSCPTEAGCGASTCVGEKLQCNAGCTWDVIEPCKIMPYECERDSTLVEPCGQCGFKSVECDGCFWNRATDCREQGTCFPGNSRTVPCFDEGCADGFGATVECSDSCVWSAPSACGGCTPGATRAQEVACVVGHPQCPNKLVQYDCTASAAANSCNTVVGSWHAGATLQACPQIECTPGQRDGNCTCNNSCEWSCGSGGVICVPGEVWVREIGCGCGVSYSDSRTCNGSGTGWTNVQKIGIENCPPCDPGDSQEQSCGSCGVKSRSCNSSCEWDSWNSCEELNAECSNGQTESQSCNHACGSGTRTRSCNGCSWGGWSSCQPDQTPACNPGQTRPVTCAPGCPTVADSCNDSCQWVAGHCPACG